MHLFPTALDCFYKQFLYQFIRGAYSEALSVFECVSENICGHVHMCRCGECGYIYNIMA